MIRVFSCWANQKTPFCYGTWRFIIGTTKAYYWTLYAYWESL